MSHITDDIKKKNAWDKIHITLTLVTPLFVAIMGWVLNQNISKVKNSIANVEAMAPYFEMMADTNKAKTKMAAYALYMLKHDDPEMAASVILAPGKPELLDVLKDLAKRDERIRQQLDKIIETTDDVGETTEIQKNAQEVIKSISNTLEGWAYLGDYNGQNRSNNRVRTNDGNPPLLNKSYKLLIDVNLRDSKPSPPDYKMGEVVGVISAGKNIEIKDIDVDQKKRVWAKVVVGN